MRSLWVTLALVAVITALVVWGGGGLPDDWKFGETNSKPVVVVVLHCPGCEATGMPAYVWRTPEGGRLACQAMWGAAAHLYEIRGSAARIYLPAARCDGWVQASQLAVP